MRKIWLMLMLLVCHVAADETLIPDTEKVTRFRLYIHDVLTGDNATVCVVAQCNQSKVLPSLFSRVLALDDLVTSEPDPNSGEVARLQGSVVAADMNERALSMTINLIFTKGEYEGSTLSIVGRNPLDREVREVSIVAGTGAFRMATGYAIITTYFADPDVYYIFEYNLVVLHQSSHAL